MDSIEQVFNDVSNELSVDTRYAYGVAILYAGVMAKMIDGFSAQYKKYLDLIFLFLHHRQAWHQDRRWEFEMHPDFQSMMLTISPTGESCTDIQAGDTATPGPEA